MKLVNKCQFCGKMYIRSTIPDFPVKSSKFCSAQCSIEWHVFICRRNYYRYRYGIEITMQDTKQSLKAKVIEVNHNRQTFGQ